MIVGTLVRKTSNGAVGVVVKSKPDGLNHWCNVLFWDERIVGCWDLELEAI